MSASTLVEAPADWRTRATLSVEEAGLVLGVSKSTAYTAVRSNQLPTIKVGSRTFVLTTGLRRLLGEVADGGAA